MEKIMISEIERSFWYDKKHCEKLKKEAQAAIEYAKNTASEIILCEYLEGVGGVKRKSFETIDTAIAEGIERHKREMGYAHVWIEIRKPGTLAKIHKLEEQIKTLRVELNKLVNELKEDE